MERVKILGNKFGLPIIYSQGNRFICLIIFKRMAQEVTARFPSLQTTLNDDYKSASCSKGQNRQQSTKRYTSLLEQLMAQSLFSL